MNQPIMDKYCICFCRVSTQQQDLVQQTNSIMLEAERMEDMYFTWDENFKRDCVDYYLSHNTDSNI